MFQFIYISVISIINPQDIKMDSNLYTVQQNDDGTKWVSGNTFIIKDQLKEMKGLWKPSNNAWLLPADADMDLLPKFKLIKKLNTFEVKDEIKAAGGIWNSSMNGWLVPESFDESIIRPRAKPKCSSCGSEEHRKDKCACPHCNLIGQHPAKSCPTTFSCYKKSGDQYCACSGAGICLPCFSLSGTNTRTNSGRSAFLHARRIYRDNLVRIGKCTWADFCMEDMSEGW